MVNFLCEATTMGSYHVMNHYTKHRKTLFGAASRFDRVDNILMRSKAELHIDGTNSSSVYIQCVSMDDY